MSEKNSYSSFRSHIISRGDRIDRVENPIVPGMPDVSCCLRPGVEFWLEIKSPTEPVKLSTALLGRRSHPVLQSQINWFRTQIQAGGLAFFLIDTDVRRMLIHGRHVEKINDMTVNELGSISEWYTEKPTGELDWFNLRNCILRLGSQSERDPTLIR